MDKKVEKALQKSTGKSGIDLAISDIDHAIAASGDPRVVAMLEEAKSHLRGDC